MMTTNGGLVNDAGTYVTTISVQGQVPLSDILRIDLKNYVRTFFSGTSDLRVDVDESITGYQFVKLGYNGSELTIALQESSVVGVMSQNAMAILRMADYLGGNLKGRPLNLTDISFREYLDHMRGKSLTDRELRVDILTLGEILKSETATTNGFRRERLYHNWGPVQDLADRILPLEPEVEYWNVKEIVMSVRNGSSNLTLYDAGYMAVDSHDPKERIDLATVVHNLFEPLSKKS